jgi:Arc/MetJ-type ribon-helix-helix transcriptional regulator
MSMVMQVRLPDDEAEFVRQRAQNGKTKSDVLREAVACLRAQETNALMLEGYREMAAFDLELAEADIGTGADSLPEW